ncbi:MAG: Hsp70 family protein [Pirellulaceae bacterium]|nr:Hsp70 family protein [Pirellulaceae bacterium]
MNDLQPVGIDLGTTNSAVAWVDATGRTAMVRNADGELLTPSVVLFEDSLVIVGKEARRLAIVEPDRVAEWVKRDMGHEVYSRPIRDAYLPPEVIQACILRRLKADLTDALGPDVGVVITVPAYFDEPRRKATADAASMAGIDVRDIVNEPTAAALAFGESIGYLSGGGDVAAEMTVLVYDLGGGTFDVTLLRLAPGNVQCLATDGDVMLGGHDWDMRLFHHLARAFQRERGTDPSRDPVSAGRLLEQAVELKHTLSARTRATAVVRHGDKSFEAAVTRDEFKELTADLLERTLQTSRETLAAAQMTWSDVDRLLLVGGATRMPMVVEAVEKLTGLAPDRSVNPDEAVARGAALYARYVLAGGTRDSEQAAREVGFAVTNVNAHGLGVRGIDPATLRETNVKLIARNTPLPASHTEKFTTKAENQRTIVIEVLQGENSDPVECASIGRTVLADLPPGLPKGHPVEVSFTYETNGRLDVRAVVPRTGREVSLSLQREGSLSNERLDEWKPLVASEAGFDAFEAMIAEALEDALPVATPTSVATSATVAPPEPSAGKAETGCKAKQPEAATLRSVPAPLSTPLRSAPSPMSLDARTVVEPASREDHLEQSSSQTAPGVRTVATSSSERPLSRWLVLLLLWFTSAVAGLAAGYGVLAWWKPDQFRLPWN